jgi:hypothetical protein
LERNPSLDRTPAFPQGGAPSGQATPNAIFDAPKPGTHDDAPERTRAPFRSLRRLTRRPDGRSGGVIDALEADALLLREENARLRVKLEAPPNVGHVIERLRSIPAPPEEPSPSHEEHGDDALHLLTEAIVMRNTLLEVCKEIGQVMAGLEARLESLTPSGHLLENGHPNDGHRANGHLKEARR